MEKVGAIIVAAGKSERMGGVEKIFALIDGKPLLAHTVETFQQSPIVDSIVIVLAKDKVSVGLDLVKNRVRKALHSIVANLTDQFSKCLRGLSYPGNRRFACAMKATSQAALSAIIPKRSLS